MSLWKSPVLYFGIALFLAVAAALLAPFVLDWNSYKPQLEAYGQRLSGRQVKIDGDVQVRLFPIPRLEADDVRIFNEGSSDTVLAASDKVVVEVTLGGLLNGSLDVQAINFDAPVINFIRRADGSLNFLLKPDEELRNSALLKKVKLERITFKNGTLVMRDESKNFERAINNFDAVLSANSIEGPWRLNGTGIQGGRAIGLNFTTSVYENDQPFGLGLKITPQDVALPQISIDGKLDKQKLSGTLRAEAVPRDGAKSSKENTISNLTMTAKLDADFNRVKLTSVKITPRNIGDGTTLVEGEITAELGDSVRISSTLEAPRINLSGVVNADGRSGIDASYLMSSLDGFIKGVPENWQVSTQASIATLTLSDGAIEEIAFNAEADQNSVRIRKFSGKSPGRSRFLFEGLAFPTPAGTTDLGGKLSFESADTREFLRWWKPDAVPAITKFWAGSRGRVKGETEVNWSYGRVELTKVRYELDGVQGTAELSYPAQGEGRSAIAVSQPVLDLDQYLTKSGGPTAKDSRLDWFSVFKQFSGEGTGSERQVTLNTGRLTLNGVPMQLVDIDLVTGPAGLIIKRFDVNAIAGADLKVEGQVMTTANGSKGGIEIKVAAQDLQGLIRLAGLPEAPTVALASLGPTNLRGYIDFSPDEKGTNANLIIEGDSAKMSLRGTGKVSVPPLEQTAKLEGDFVLTAADASQLVQWVGYQGETSGAAATMTTKFNGDVDAGVQVQSQITGFGSDLKLDGTVALTAERDLGFLGRGNLATSDASQLAKGFGFPWAKAVPLALDFEKKTGAEQATEIVFTGKIGPDPLEGSATWSKSGELYLDLALPEVNLTEVLGPLIFEWDGKEPSFGSRLAPPAKDKQTSEIWLRSKTFRLADNWVVEDGVVGLRREATKSTLTLRGKNSGRDVKFEVESTPGKDGLAHTFKWDLPWDISTIVSSQGKPVLQGLISISAKAQSLGDTVQAVLGNLAGNGVFGISDVRISDIDLDGFVKEIATAGAQDQVSAALSLLERGAGSVIPGTTGPLTIENGVVTLVPMPANFNDARATLALAVDLSLQTIDSKLSVALAKPSNAPPVEVNFAGGFADVNRTVKSGALASLMGYDILARDMAELEKVKQEEERLAREEAEQIDRDQEKFEAYQEQRAEIRLRQRELRVHAAERKRLTKDTQDRLTAIFAEVAPLRKSELARRNRELVVFRATRGGKASARVKSRPMLPDVGVSVVPSPETPKSIDDLIGNSP
jgi:uncharacterized protein involved in outer membrane biogenesis